MDYSSLLSELAQQENVLQFDSFSNDDAFQIGMYLYEKAKKDGKAITIDITRNGQQLFHAALPGTSPDNDQWIIRKNRVVNRFCMSSFRVGIKLADSQKTLEEKYNLSTFDYAPHGGAFPIAIRNTGVIGTITVSGLAQAEDHAMAVDAISAFLNGKLAP